jgi:hypothetical protein
MRDFQLGREEVHVRSGARQIQPRRLVLVGAWLMILSFAFPGAASVLPAGPVWVGWLDVVLAFAVTALALFVFAISYRQVDDAARLASFHVYRILANVLIALLAVFFLCGNRIDWTILLTGLAWRLWLVCYVLPAAVTALRVE